jgi:hypothetical protein
MGAIICLPTSFPDMDAMATCVKLQASQHQWEMMCLVAGKPD